MKKIAVLIPCYNERNTIGKVVSDYKRVLPEADIYVYDNCSTDDTAAVAEAHGAIVKYECRQGKGNVVRQMFHDIEADCYFLVDGDDTYPAEAAPEMCEAILSEQYDMVIGDRLSSTYFQENKRRFHDTGNRLVKYLINQIFHSDIKDIMTGCRALSRQVVKSMPLLSKGFEIETEMTIFALDNNWRIRQIPISYKDRPEGSESKLSTFSDGMKVLTTIFRLFRDYKPLRFFSYIALFLVFIALVALIPVLVEYLHTGLVPRYPTLIVCGFVILFAMLLWVCGIILEVMLVRHRQLCQLFQLK